MGVFLNPGKEAFEEAVNSKIYVDKTEMILYLNSIVKTKQKYASTKGSEWTDVFKLPVTALNSSTIAAG